MAGDFGSLAGTGKRAAVSLPDAKQSERAWLKVFETLPSQLLNVFGRSAYVDMDNLAVWTELKKPLKTGAKWMSELASGGEERQGIGLNRWLQVMVAFLQYQQEDRVNIQNAFIMKEQLYQEMYDEIEKFCRVLSFASLLKCMEPKKGHQLFAVRPTSKRLYLARTLPSWTSMRKRIRLHQPGQGLAYPHASAMAGGWWPHSLYPGSSSRSDVS
ncbi:hypothetical protein N9L19_00565 [bacterium]|nr:hypothetical protein [bacterium]